MTSCISGLEDDERAEQLTAQLCRHWEVATERLEGLTQELEAGMDTCIEAEVYAAMMRMQSSVIKPGATRSVRLFLTCPIG